jgi:hypothetical protein
MLMTILEAHVTKENWAALEQAYREGVRHKDLGVTQSFLVQGTNDPELWRIVTIWTSQAALDELRASGVTPRGVLMFRTAQAEPSLSIFEIAQQLAPEWIG